MKRFTIFLGADHNGFALKEGLKRDLLTQGHHVEDLTPKLVPGDDYPLQARAVVRAMKKNPTARGVLVCGSGVGVTIAANRHKGIRAFAAHSTDEITHVRNDEDANVIALSGWELSHEQAMHFLHTFLTTPASRAARHQRRITELG